MYNGVNNERKGRGVTDWSTVNARTMPATDRNAEMGVY